METKTVILYIEGGQEQGSRINSENTNRAALARSLEGTADMTQNFRRAFNKLFNQALGGSTGVKVEVIPSGGYQSTIKSYLSHKAPNTACLVLDSDAPRERKFEEILKRRPVLKGHLGVIFPMVQAMEAWILAQPHAILHVLHEEPRVEVFHSSLTHKDGTPLEARPSEYQNPGDILYWTLRNMTAEPNEARPSFFKYGKLKNSWKFIEQIQLQELSEVFEEVAQLVTFIKAQ